MLNDIIEAISIALNAEFGDRYKVHMEEIKQGLQEPCFYISEVGPSAGQFLGNRYFSTKPFCIQYFPESPEIRRECNVVADRMWLALEYITCIGDDKPIRGTNMHWEMKDGVLNFFVNYDLFMLKQETEDAMEDLTQQTLMKGGD